LLGRGGTTDYDGGGAGLGLNNIFGLIGYE